MTFLTKVFRKSSHKSCGMSLISLMSGRRVGKVFWKITAVTRVIKRANDEGVDRALASRSVSDLQALADAARWEGDLRHS